MHSWQYELGDVLIITHKGVEQVARVAGYDDSLDNTTPLYVNLRISGGLRWGERMVKVRPEQIRGEDREWYARQEVQWQGKTYTILSIIDRGGKLCRRDMNWLEDGKPGYREVAGKYLAAGKTFQFSNAIFRSLYAQPMYMDFEILG